MAAVYCRNRAICAERTPRGAAGREGFERILDFERVSEVAWSRDVHGR
jgi:hypothetical protein